MDENYHLKDPNGYGKADPVQPRVTKKHLASYGTQNLIVDRNGCKMQIMHKTVSVYDTNGKLFRQESIVDYTKENIQESMLLWITLFVNG